MTDWAPGRVSDVPSHWDEGMEMGGVTELVRFRHRWDGLLVAGDCWLVSPEKIQTMENHHKTNFQFYTKVPFKVLKDDHFK